jgi:hypothetical protein
VRHRVGGGRGVDGRGSRWRRQGHSPAAGRCEAEQEEGLVSGGSVEWRMQLHEFRRAAGGRAGGTVLNGRACGMRRVRRVV